MPKAAFLGLPLVWLEVQAHLHDLEEEGPEEEGLWSMGVHRAGSQGPPQSG